MTGFDRKFAQRNELEEAVVDHAPWFLDLLGRWQPAGKSSAIGSDATPVTPAGDLRLAVRNGYLNFYCGGQSVARVHLTGHSGNPGKKRLWAETHQKYLSEQPSDDQKYDVLDEKHWQTETWLADLIERTQAYQGKEKLFVEKLVAKNPLVVDLEVALPGFEVDEPDGSITKLAPRIDLAVLEPVVDGLWRLVFWEVKMSDDGRVRSEGEPEVVTQLNKYAEWLTKSGNNKTVLHAYRSAIKVLVDINDFATANGRALNGLDPALRAIADDPEKLVGVDPQVRLAIRMVPRETPDPRFQANCRDRLDKADVRYQVFEADEKDLALPVLKLCE
ncbi:hypothetical protein [Paracoccus sphaerophysae]|uniref:hypothetical protein n=1 Tax=Paracoccus sphaerophysae TaxID=690417 RepID=UPI002357FE62|nr:hypothetical protein [Paracoccus sphaerophysae]